MVVHYIMNRGMITDMLLTNLIAETRDWIAHKENQINEPP
jgi:hypothetical protein